MAKIWAAAFWGTTPGSNTHQFEPNDNAAVVSKVALYLPMVVLALLTLAIGFLTEPVFDLATRAAEQLLNPTGYVQAVLGGSK